MRLYKWMVALAIGAAAVGLSSRVACGVEKKDAIFLEPDKAGPDFVVQGDSKSLHVLNAVSPAWTCSGPFAKYVCDQIERANGQGETED